MDRRVLIYTQWVRITRSPRSGPSLLPGSAVFVALLAAAPFAAAAQTAPPQSAKGATPAIRILKAQPAEVQPAAAPPVAAGTPDYSNEPLVEELSETIYRYNADGTGERTLRAVLHLQSDAAVRQFGLLNFNYAADNETVELKYVRVRKADGTVLATDASAAQDLPAEVTRQAPLYSDQHELQIPVRSLAVGDRLEYEAVIHLRKAEVPGQFWGAAEFEKRLVALDERVELRLPAGRHVTVLSPAHPPETAKEQGESVYRWHSRQAKPTVAPPGGAAPSDEDAPSLPAIPDVAWTTFADWAAVGDWYRTLAGDRAQPDDALRAKAAALTAGAATDDEKITRLYSFVSMQIRYIGVDFGVGRYQPHAAAEVLSNGYGDCKDKHTLLAALLAAAGFHADPVLIGANIRIDKDLPAPNSFNHVITAVEEAGGKRLWLDSTAEVAPPGMLTEGLRDKDALLMPTSSGGTAAEKPMLVKTPAAAPFPAFDHYDSHATLSSEGKLTAHFDVTLRGDFELVFRAALFSRSRSDWGQIGQAISSNLGFGGTVTHFTPTAVDTPAQPLHITYDYERDSYGDWPNHHIVSLIPGGLFSGATYSKQPDDPIELGTPRTESSNSTITLPKGFSIPTLPAGLHAQSSFARFDITYTLHGSDLVTEERLQLLVPSIPAAEWQSYNTFINDMTSNTGIFITLAESASGAGKTAEAASGSPAAPAHVVVEKPAASSGAVLNTDAQALIAESLEALQKGNLDTAAARLASARTLNPEQPGLLTAEGLIAGQKRDYATAEADFRKEGTLHPELHDRLLPTLLWAQTQQKHPADEISTLEEMRKLKPDDTDLARHEAALLTTASRHEEAVSLLEGVALHHPANKRLLLALGNAQFAAGRTREGQTTLETALEDTDDPSILNDAAYELADRNLDLALAQKDAARALTLLDAETGKTSLDTLTADQLARENLLGAAWDTCGWIEYLQGHLDAAESYLRATWVQFESPENGYHLGQILEKQGKPQEALALYILAGTGADTTASGSPDMQAMAKRRDALAKTGLKAEFSQGESVALANIRSLRLPLFTKGHTEAEFFVLASSSAVEKVVFVEGDAQLKDKALVLQQALTRDRSSLLFPSGSAARLVRRGVLSCSSLTGYCELTFYLPRDTRLPKAPLSANVEEAKAKPQ